MIHDPRCHAAPAAWPARSCASCWSLSAVRHIAGKGRVSSDSSVFVSRWYSRPWTRCSWWATSSVAASRSTSCHVSPSTSPFRRPRTRIRTYAAYSGSCSLLADSRKALASLLVHVPRFRLRRDGSFTVIATFREINSSAIACVRAERKTALTPLTDLSDGRLWQHLPTAQQRLFFSGRLASHS